MSSLAIGNYMAEKLIWTDFTLGPSLGQTRIAKLKSAYNLLVIGPRGLGYETNLQEIMGRMSSDVVCLVKTTQCNHGLGVI